jgi:hypothetical protein
MAKRLTQAESELLAEINALGSNQTQALNHYDLKAALGLERKRLIKIEDWGDGQLYAKKGLGAPLTS